MILIIRIFMIDLNQKSTIKKIEWIEKSAKKSIYSLIDLLLTDLIQFHDVKDPIGPYTYR